MEFTFEKYDSNVQENFMIMVKSMIVIITSVELLAKKQDFDNIMVLLIIYWLY